MNSTQRPWWVFAMQMPLFDTTLQEDHRPGQRTFTVYGRPVAHSLHWITYGPLCAVIALVAVGAAAWGFDARAQDGPVKLVAACALGGVPALAWLAGGLVFGRAGRAVLDRLAGEQAQRVEITLDLQTRTLRVNHGPPLSWSDIGEFKLVSDAGLYYTPEEPSGSMFNLMVDTAQGQLELLPKELGNVRQKLQLAGRLQALVAGPDVTGHLPPA